MHSGVHEKYKYHHPLQQLFYNLHSAGHAALQDLRYHCVSEVLVIFAFIITFFLRRLALGMNTSHYREVNTREMQTPSGHTRKIIPWHTSSVVTTQL